MLMGEKCIQLVETTHNIRTNSSKTNKMGNVPKVVIMLPWNGINNDESKREQEKKHIRKIQ